MYDMLACNSSAENTIYFVNIGSFGENWPKCSKNLRFKEVIFIQIRNTMGVSKWNYTICVWTIHLKHSAQVILDYILGVFIANFWYLLELQSQYPFKFITFWVNSIAQRKSCRFGTTWRQVTPGYQDDFSQFFE